MMPINNLNQYYFWCWLLNTSDIFSIFGADHLKQLTRKIVPDLKFNYNIILFFLSPMKS
jgi:hypothetical protein